MLPVRWVDCAEEEVRCEAGLMVTYDDYRNLEKNVKRLRAYAAELESLVWLYRGGEDASDG